MQDAASHRSLTGVVCGEQHLSHAAFETEIRRAAAGLRALGVGPEDCVALLLRNDLPFLVASRAAAWVGAYTVPVNWHLAAPEVAHILADCGAGTLFAHADLWHGVREAIPDRLRCILVETPPTLCSQFELEDRACAVPQGQMAWRDWLDAHAPIREAPRQGPPTIIYTSGTTGRPKGIRRAPPTPQAAARARDFRARVYGCREGGRCLVPGPLYHSAPNRYALQAAETGELVVIMPRFDAEAFLRLVQGYAITGAMMVPIMFIRLLKLPEAVRHRHDLSSLEFIAHGAAPCPPEVKARMIEWFGPVINEYFGSTESGPIAACTSADALQRPGTVGRVVPEADVRILDSRGRRLPPGEVGEIYSRSAAMNFTYNGQPEARAAIEADGYITSGDMGYLDGDGYLYIADRAKDMVISGGVNIYPAEIEAALHTCPGVRDCAVFGVPDEEFGEALLAVIEPEAGHHPTAEVIQAHLRERLAGYKVPRRIEFRHDLPREDSGKIFKRRLRDAYWQASGRRI